EDGIRDVHVTGVQTCALPISTGLACGSRRSMYNSSASIPGDQLMIYEGKAITVKALEGGIVELNFDLKGESVNKFNRLTLNELQIGRASCRERDKLPVACRWW